MKIISWNVNGIRAVQKKGFVDWLRSSQADVIAIQETKAQEVQLDDELINIVGYKSYFKSAEKKGYSGVALYTKKELKKVEILGVEEFDAEGRVIIGYFDDLAVVNCYFPNSQKEGARLDYKLRFCEAIFNKCKELEKSTGVVLCGDYNIAHEPIDLKNPKSNEKNPGFLPEERAWMTQFLSSGFHDVFREEHENEEGHYTWWSYRFSARAKNIGWRIDYLCVNSGLRSRIKNSEILKDVLGSDHCPVGITLEKREK